MKMSKSIFHIQSMHRSLARPLALAALVVILALSIGGALAARMEHRASQDRLTIGDTADQG
jgi:hypothetical protein